MLGLLLSLQMLLSGPVAAPPDTIPRVLAPSVVPSDTLVQITECPGTGGARVGTIFFAGNDITRERILRAELDFREGDTLSFTDLRPRLEANRRRLFNLQLFHSVLVQASCRNGQLLLVFSLQERFYTFPVPILSLADRNLRSWLNRTDRWQRVDYGLHILRANFRGRNEQVIANLQFGFNRKYELFYEAPGLGAYRRVGFGTGVSFYQSHTLDFITRSDRHVPFRAESAFPIQRFYLTGGLRFRHTVQFLTSFDIAYHREQITDSINFYNPSYYNGRTQREYLNFNLISTRNQRNTFAYPLTGKYAQAMLSYRLFLTPGSPSLTTLRLRYSRYLALGRGFYYSAGITGQARLSRQLAYADARALGYESLVRGYDEYVVDGQHYALVQQGVSYRPFKASQVHFRAIRNPKINTIPLVLYLNVFTDAGYVASSLPLPNNRLPNRLLSAVGVGLHLVTYYDRVFTAEYTLNGLGETGYFFRTAFPI